jgi:tetratricopeptide (TPR) repeat protein
MTDTDKIIEKGHELMGRAQPAMAARFFLKALEQRSEDTSIMDTLADCFLGMGDARSALPLIERSIELAPESSPYKYLYMAQLEEGHESLASFQTAIRVFTKLREENGGDGSSVFNMEVENGNGGKKAVGTNKELAKAYCGIAELYLTDLCDEEDAEQQCESALMTALEHDKDNLDAKQTLASMRISQCNPVEACTVIEGVFDEVFTLVKDAQNKPILDMVSEAEKAENNSNSNNSGERDVPDPAFLLQTCKLMIECAPDKPELAVKALDLLELLLNQSDEDPELWFVMGMGAMACEPKEADQAKEAFERSRALIEKAIERAEEEEEEEADGEGGVEEQWQGYLDLIDQQLSTIDIEEEGQWEDIEDDEEEDDDE